MGNPNKVHCRTCDYLHDDGTQKGACRARPPHISFDQIKPDFPWIDLTLDESWCGHHQDFKKPAIVIQKKNRKIAIEYDRSYGKKGVFYAEIICIFCFGVGCEKCDNEGMHSEEQIISALKARDAQKSKT